ncbi:MAG: hypothetical protein GX608_03465, partial [Lentisphaerae bacterium]|nr:hypothetical protein [Lentisphaerota bacterium]
MNVLTSKSGNPAASAWLRAAVFGVCLHLCMPASAAARTWTGAGANGLATTPANWGGTAPQAGDDIVLDAGSHSNMTWNMTNLVIGSWSQIGYRGTVTVATVYGPAGFTNLTITGNCTISNGVWTHAANSGGETNRLRVSINGNLVVGPDGAINATGKGYASQKGPGRGNSGCGAGYGGR